MRGGVGCGVVDRRLQVGKVMKYFFLVLLLVSTIAHAQVTTDRFQFTFNENDTDLEHGFGVLQRAPGESQFSEIMRLPENSTAFLVDVVGLPNDEFCYNVYAFNNIGNSEPTNTECARIEAPPPTIPNIPTGVKVLSVGNTSITIGWIDNSDNETAFRIYRKAWNRSSYTFYSTRPANAVSYTNSSLRRKKTYCYQIAAVNAVGESKRTFPVCGTTK